MVYYMFSSNKYL